MYREFFLQHSSHLRHAFHKRLESLELIERLFVVKATMSREFYWSTWASPSVGFYGSNPENQNGIASPSPPLHNINNNAGGWWIKFKQCHTFSSYWVARQTDDEVGGRQMVIAKYLFIIIITSANVTLLHKM